MRVWLVIWAFIGTLFAASAALADDRDTLTAFLEDNLSGAGRVVTITGFQGALSSQARIETLTIADDGGVWLRMQGITLDWNRAALLGGTLSVSKLTADRVELPRLPVTPPADASLPAPEAVPFALPQLPVAVTLGEISAKELVLGPAVLGQAVTGTMSADASLVNGQGHLRLALQRTDGITGNLSIIAVYANATNALTLALDAEEAAGGLAVTALGIPGRPAAHLILGGKGPLDDFAASMTLQTDGETRLAGQMTLAKTETPGETGFRADLTGNMAPLFAPDYAAFFGDRLGLHVEGRRGADGATHVQALDLTARALRLQGQIDLAADGLPDVVSLTGDLAQPDGAPVLLPLPGTETRLNRATLSLTFDRATSPDWQGRIEALGLDRPDLRADRLVVTGTGQIRHEGDARGLTADLALEGAGLAPADPALARALGDAATARVTLGWQSGSGQVDLSDLSVEAANTSLTTKGQIASDLTLTGSLTLRARDLARFADLAGRPLAGAADLDLTGWVNPLSGAFDADLVLSSQSLALGQAQADALLNGPTRVALSGARGEGGTDLRHLTVTANDLQADLTGRITSTGADLSGRVALADLATLNLGLGGAVDLKGSFIGLLSDGHAILTGTGQDLTLGQAQADALGRGQTALDLDVHLAGARIDIMRATVSGPAGRVQATGVYDPKASDLDLALDLPDLSLLSPSWRGGLTARAGVTGPIEALRTQISAQSTGLGIGQVLVDRLIGGVGQLTAGVTLDGKRLVIEALDFATPAVQLSATGQPQDLQVKARLANLGLILPDFPGPLTAEGRVQQTDAGTALDLALRGPGQINARLAGDLSPDLARADLTAKGTAQAGLANVLIAPRVVAGQLAFDLALQGPLRLDSLRGTARLTDGRLADPDQPVSLVGIDARADLAGGAARITLQSGLASGGSLLVTGRVGLAPPMPADLAIQLNNAVIRDPQLFSTTLNGALTFQGPALGGAAIRGTLTLARTELRIPSTGMGSVPVLTDLRHRNDRPEVRATRVRAGLEGASARGATGGGGYGLDLLILAPNQVFIRGRGLDAELGGQVRLRGTTAAIVPSGALSLIRGRLDLLGKRLTLSEASLQMQGALVPYVRIAASTQSEGFNIEAVIEGDAANPNVSFQSSPALPQEEVLARLLFDKGLTNLSPFQAAQLASAVATLAGKGGEGVIGTLRKRAGLDNLDVQADGTGNTSVTVGKYLSEKVYTEVTVDQTGKSTINLNLDVARHITLRGKVDDEGQTGIGIYLEKDY